MNQLHAELRWLPRVPADFTGRLKALGSTPDPLGRELQALALPALDVNQLTRLTKAVAKARAEGRSLDPLVPFRLAILSNSTIDMIVPPLVATAEDRWWSC